MGRFLKTACILSSVSFYSTIKGMIKQWNWSCYHIHYAYPIHIDLSSVNDSVNDSASRVFFSTFFLNYYHIRFVDVALITRT
jgi:hypothetical protein